MAYLTTIDLVQGDQLPEIEITLKDSNTAATGLVLDDGDPETFAHKRERNNDELTSIYSHQPDLKLDDLEPLRKT